VSVVDFVTFHWQKSYGDFILSEAYDVKVKVIHWQVSCSHRGTRYTLPVQCLSVDTDY